MRTYYHGCSEEDAERILAEGLKPWRYEEDPGTRVGRVFLTPLSDYAAFFGDVVLKVELPRGVRVYGAGLEVEVMKPIPADCISAHGQSEDIKASSPRWRKVGSTEYFDEETRTDG